MLYYALTYAAVGIPVIPVHSVLEDGTCTCGKADCKQAGKHPRVSKGFKEATTDPKRIKQWWKEGRWPNASIAGRGGTWLCLDIDAKSDGLNSLERLVASNSPLPDTAVVETGEYEVDGEMVRGRHYWFRMPEGQTAATRAGVLPGIDIRCHNGYAVLPPSSHKSGVKYEWVEGCSIEDATTAPDWLLEMLPEVVESDASWEPTLVPPKKDVWDFVNGEADPVPIGEQRAFLPRFIRALLGTGRDVEAVTNMIWEPVKEWDNDPSAEPWTKEDILYMVEDLFRKGPNSAPQKDFSKKRADETDLGNGLRLVDAYPEGHLMFIPEWNIWYIWDGQNFIEDSGAAVRAKFGDEVCLKMYEEALKEGDGDAVKRISSHVLRSRMRPRVEAALWAAGDLVATSGRELNQNPDLLNVQNGVIDLETGELLDPDPSYLMTKQSKATYDPDAESDVWEEFLERIVPEADLRDFLQKAFGYTLTGHTWEQKFYYLHGPPASGKTTLLEAFSHLMGNYAEAAEAATFMRRDLQATGGPSEDIARLSNSRMVVTHETESGTAWAEGQISKMTGTDKMTARFAYGKTFEFYPKFKLWFSANNIPRVSGGRSGLWRRIMVVPFEQEIPEKEQDPLLLMKLRSSEVQQAILAWAVRGSILWYEDRANGKKMKVPEIVREEVAAYRRDADPTARFFEEMVDVTHTDDDRITSADLYSLYTWWTEKEGIKYPKKRIAFGKRVTEETGLRGQMVWNGAAGKEQQTWIGIKAKQTSGIKLPDKG